jgi:acetyl-CoA carboxylase carboxyl transferase subunit beta
MTRLGVTWAYWFPREAASSFVTAVVDVELGALVGFVGPSVIEQTMRQELPQGFQRSEFLLDHGLMDIIVHRKELGPKLEELVAFFAT